MKPVVNILFINISLVIILFIFFAFLSDFLFYLPPFLGILATVNLGLGGFFTMNGEKSLGMSFLAGFLVVALCGLALVYYVFIGIDRPWNM